MLSDGVKKEGKQKKGLPMQQSQVTKPSYSALEPGEMA